MADSINDLLCEWCGEVGKFSVEDVEIRDGKTLKAYACVCGFTKDKALIDACLDEGMISKLNANGRVLFTMSQILNTERKA